MNKIKLFATMFGKNDYLKPVYFNIDILESYFKNPRYLITYTDYRGSIHLKDKYCTDDNEYESIKNFGLAYLKADNNKRAVVVFANDLLKLPIKSQGMWYSKMLDNQSDYVANSGFIENLILGQWVENISIFQAVLMEIHYINEMCECMMIPKLYKKEYLFNSSNQDERPLHFHNVLLPTRENYYNFINTFEKLVVHNLNYKTFQKDSLLISKVERNNEKGEPKGSLVMFEEWLNKNLRGIDCKTHIINPLRMLRKLRQIPAHELYENEYDENIWKDQDELLIQVYTGVRNIRLNFANHPSCQVIKIPDELYDGEHIVCY